MRRPSTSWSASSPLLTGGSLSISPDADHDQVLGLQFQGLETLGAHTAAFPSIYIQSLHAPKLRHVDLWGFSVDWGRLSDLRVLMITGPTFRSEIDEVYLLLRACPGLEIFQIQGGVTPPTINSMSNLPSAPVFLPHLEYLLSFMVPVAPSILTKPPGIPGSSPSSDFLGPTPSNSTTTVIKHDSVSARFDGLVSNNIKAIHFGGARAREDLIVLNPILQQQFPNIKELVVTLSSTEGKPDAYLVIEALVLRLPLWGGVKWLFPGLTTLHLKACREPICDGVLAVVLARQNEGLEAIQRVSIENGRIRRDIVAELKARLQGFLMAGMRPGLEN
ncbi:hypothetical protein M407DRAFT_17679 [Tulasnella calospora MUT 4182]|uniref:F-box domain-containing protein n=1 Tax=Tulasnella calospora MUT 4182 TaxID=1051891 RepID=A0A0C3LHH7_9AGAM|nr:hypothetical protein M407DRAFT_17679 [Tulasnella calospora MUT 4182]